MKRTVFSLLFVALAVSSCKKPPTSVSNDLFDAQARWKAQHMVNYSMIQTRLCFCSEGGVPREVVVRDNAVVDVIDTTTHTSVPGQEWPQYKTIDQLFAIVRGINPDSVAALRVEYNQELGFPSSFYVDPSAQIADEEYGYQVRDVKPE